MPKLLSPFAPVHNWLCRALRIGWDGSRLQSRGFAVHFREPPEREELDLRDFATRALVLDALDHVGHARPWALGRCWSLLTDEQAGRVTAAIVRAIGADPKRPASPIPFGVLSEWTTPADLAEDSKPLRSHRYSVALEWRVLVLGNDDWGRYSGVFREGWIADFRTPEGVHYLGDERGDEGKAAADEAAMASGALLWEQITPPEKPDA